MSSNKTSNKRKKKNGKKKGKGLTIFLYFLIFCMVVGLVAAGGVYAYVMNIISDLPNIDTSDINDSLIENSYIYDSEGRLLETVQKDGLRTILKYNEISPNVIDAFVAVEDKTFWTHDGLNYVRLIGAVVEGLQGERIGGTSTITQQLARNLYLPETKSDRNIERKIKEIFYAKQMENELQKEQIIEGYLNLIYLGGNSYGVEAAAQTYFNKSASELNMVESGMLAGIPKSPTAYAPIKSVHVTNITDEHNDLVFYDDKGELIRFGDYVPVYNPKCEDRYKVIVYLMKENGYITESEYESMKSLNLKDQLHPTQQSAQEITSYFADMVIDDVVRDLMAQYGYTYDEAQNMLYTRGYSIYSTIDFDMQKTLESNYSLTDFSTYFGESTYSAVKDFQREYELVVDGVAGTGTLTKLAEVSEFDMESISTSLFKKGMDNEDVILLKQALYQLDLLKNNENFPMVTVHFDENKNIWSVTKTNNKVNKKLLLYKQDNLVNEDGKLMIPESDYYYSQNGDLVLKRGGIFNFYRHTNDDGSTRIQVVVKDTFTYDEDSEANNRVGWSSGLEKYNIVDMYTYTGRDVDIPNEYKSYDDESNLVIDRDFLVDDPTFFMEDSEGRLTIDDENYTISDTGVIQPQSAMVIIDYKTGQLKAIVGGRNVYGKKIYNRAINPRQPGSSIKPIGVYIPAIDSRKYTAATVVDDVPAYLGPSKSVRWPLNWYETSSAYPEYWGLQTVRNGIEYSLNVVAAKIANDIGVDTCLEYIKKFGITSIVDPVDENGKVVPVNDHNLSAVSLGGMTNGISPLEITSAYGAIANGGIHVATSTYTKVVDNDGITILEKQPIKTFVVDEKAAYIVQDMMESGVTSGLSSTAQITSGNFEMPVAGKTGTTSNKIDAWFVGYTPYYVAGIWFGNDVNIPLDQGSKVAAKFWSNVMKDIHADLEPKTFIEPEGLIEVYVDTISGKRPSDYSYMDPRNTVRKEIFIPGTEPKVTDIDDVHVAGTICVESGKLVNEYYCPTTLIEDRVFTQRLEPYIPEDHLKNGEPLIPRDWIYELPTEECDIHTGETISESIYDLSQNPLFTFPDGSRIVVVPFKIILNNNEEVLLPIRTKILVDNTISFPDGSVIPGSMVREIPEWTPPVPESLESQTDSLIDAMDATDDTDATNE